MTPDHDDISSYGPYRVIREIGRGGMGVVYEVEHDGSSQRLALKVLPAVRSANPRVVERFRREAKATARLKHRNIIGVHYFGCEQGLHYFVMDLVDGRNLEDIIFRLRRRSENAGDFLSSVSDEISEVGAHDESSGEAPRVTVCSPGYVRTMVRLIREVADALHVSHAAGLVHRDIKPSNLILSSKGRLVLTDFGLVQDTQAQTFTQTGEILGTPLYMSPEQIAAKTRKTGLLTDVYSLGATLYEALSLQAPFAGSDLPSLVYQIQFVDPKPLTELNSSVPKGLNDIVAQAMAKAPSSRFESAKSLADDLGRFLEGRPVKARPPGRVSKIRQAVARHPEIQTALVVAMSLVLLVVGYEVFDAVMNRRAGASEFVSYTNDSARLLKAGDFGPAWRANEEALRRSPGDTGAKTQRTLILETMFKDVQSGLSGSESLNEPLRLVQQMNSFAPKHAFTALAKQQLLEALKTSIRARVVDREHALARDLLERYRGVLLETESSEAARLGVEDLRYHVARDLMAAALLAHHEFRFNEISEHLDVAETFGEGGTLPSPDPRLLQDFSGRSWGVLQDVAARALSPDAKARGRAINELADSRVFVRLPYTAALRLVRRLLTSETDIRLKGRLLDLVRTLQLGDMAGELLSMVRSDPELRSQLIPVLGAARDPRCREYLLEQARDQTHADTDAVITALASYPGGSTEEALLRMLGNSKSVDRQILCCWSLAQISARGAASKILEVALRVDGEASMQAVAALIKLMKRSGLEAPVKLDSVLTLRKKSASPLHQVNCLRLLNGDKTPQTLAHLVSELNSVSPVEVRAEAAHALGRCGSLVASQLLKSVLENKNESLQLRLHATLSLAQIRGSNAIAFLENALTDSEEGVRLAAARALGLRRGSAAAIRALQQAYRQDDSEIVRGETVRSLMKLGRFEFAVKLVDALGAYDPGGASAILNSIVNAGSSSARLFEGLLYQLNLSDDPQANDRDGLRAEERLVIQLCQAVGSFGADQRWVDGAQRRKGVESLQRLIELPRAHDAIRAAALAALSNFPRFITSAEIVRLMEVSVSLDIQRAGVLSLARIGASERAHIFFSSLTDFSAMDCFSYARVWGLAGNTSKAGIWLTKAIMLGFDRTHLLRATPSLDAARRSARVRFLLDA